MPAVEFKGECVMSFADSISQSLKKYFDFSGRASRSEFWFFLLFVALCDAVAGVFGRSIGGLVMLALFVPQITVAVRRLHDVGKSGRELVVPYVMMAAGPMLYWAGGFLIGLVKLAYGVITLLVVVRLVMLWAKKGSTIPNKYGAAPTAFSFAKA